MCGAEICRGIGLKHSRKLPRHANVGLQSIQQVYQYLNVDVKIPQGNSSNSQELLGRERELLEWLRIFP
jgi:hypothetical protein